MASDKTNPVCQLFLTYTTPCDTFSVSVPSDTTVCQDSPLQLNASGGQHYEWQPATGLSCTDCPNPVFSSDSSMFYTVRIWNNDSCSVVRPVHITVVPNPKSVGFTSFDTRCSTPNSGVIQIQSTSEMEHFYAIHENGDTLVNTGQYITNLPAGNYTVYYTNANGCKSSDTVLKIGYQKEATAGFTVVPNSGSAPLNVQITNTSQNATGYQWSVNGISTSATPPTIFDTAGAYQIQLIAWNTDPHCADTITKTVLVYDSLLVQIPNVFTPNEDGVNDIFTISVNIPAHAKITIFNRWGNAVYHYDGNLPIGTTLLWNGMSNGQYVSDGTYFYKAVFLLKEENIDCTITKCKVEESGFITVIR